MSRYLAFALIATCLVFLAFGCSAPRTPIASSIYCNVKDALLANPGDVPANPKCGISTATSIVGITFGDCSIEAAMKSQQLKKIYYVDYESLGILGVYAKTTTKVYGD